MARKRQASAFFSDMSEFEAFYARNSRDLMVFFARRVFDGETAFDLMAETFAEALASRTKFRGGSEPEALAWTYAIARHKLSRYFRRGRVEQRSLERLGLEVEGPGPEEVERIEELADLRGLRGAMASALASLSAPQRDALTLRVVNELPYEEVARRLQLTEQAARARVSRGLRALAQNIELAVAREERT
jgi:RNA polymerase sigma-70 factor (ECF subfamily)